MDATDYGPVPVSRLKAEAQQVFRALDQGRRVLISRRGEVVAAIEPAAVSRHAELLAQFAVAPAGEVRELTATTISQGSPGEFVRQAEVAGAVSYVTREHRVFGLLAGISPATPSATPSDGEAADQDELLLAAVDDEERVLAEFERTHPQATPEEFAAASVAASMRTRSVLGDQTSAVAVPAVSAAPEPLPDDYDALVEALFVKARATAAAASAADAEGSEASFADLAEEFAGDQRADVRAKIIRSMVDLGDHYVQDQPEKALQLADGAIQLISKADGLTINGRSRHRVARPAAAFEI